MRFGFKAWSLCTTSGYLVNFEIYQGKNPRSHSEYEDRFGKCAAPLIAMIDDFPNDVKCLPFSFFFDNLFTSFPLLAYLKLRGYNGTGTIRQNRVPSNCPLDKKDLFKKKGRGYYQSIKMDETDIYLTKWKDNNVVSVASTVFSVNPKSTASRYSKDAGKKIHLIRPCSITEYNKSMCGVDRFDQNVSLYRIGFRGKKWWSCIFTWLIDACVQNAWLLHRHGLNTVDQFEFRRELAVFYCKHYGVPAKNSGPQTTHNHAYDLNNVKNTLRFDGIKHYVVPIEKKRRCARDTCKSIIRTACGKCDIGLCVPCFADYHTQQ